MEGHVRITSSTTVNEAIRRCPETIAVFNRFGIDSCCGGAVSIEEAAMRDGADPGEVMRQIEPLLVAGQ
jgi:iron-sulfur cluster repair protein YtfE (RIC family)